MRSLISSVETTLQTIAFHHVSSLDLFSNLTGCSSLRRLEIGRLDSEFEGVSLCLLYNLHRHLRTLRLHFDCSVLPETIIAALERRRLGGRYLESLELVGSYSSDAGEEQWKNPKMLDKLILVAKEKGTILMINGRMIETMGDLWVSLKD